MANHLMQRLSTAPLLSGWRLRVGLLLGGAIVTFLGGLVATRHSEIVYQARCTVQTRALSEGAQDAAAKAIEEMVARPRLLKALQVAGPSSSTTLADDRLESLHRQLTIEQARPNEHQVKTRLTVVGANQSWASAFLQSVADQAIQERRHESAAWQEKKHRAEKLAGQLTVLREEIRKRKTKMDALADDIRRRLKKKAEFEARLQARPDLTQPQVNPKWERLDGQRADLERSRKALLDKYTVRHPIVLRLQQEIDDLASQMSQIPQHLQPPPAETPTPPEDATVSAESVATLERIRSEHAALVSELKKHEPILASLQAEIDSYAKFALEIVRPVEVAAKDVGGRSAKQWGMILLASMLAGALLTFVPSGLGGGGVMRTVADVERVGLPVVGVVS